MRRVTEEISFDGAYGGGNLVISNLSKQDRGTWLAQPGAVNASPTLDVEIS